MTFDPTAEREHELVNQIALVFEHGGLPPVAGRIVGRLLICDPPHQSSTQLADYTNASRGSISTSTRMLMAARIIERVRFPGDRSSYFRIHAGCWEEMLFAEMARMKRLRSIGDEALDFLDGIGAAPERKARIKEFRDFSAFFEKEFPVVLDHWKNRSPK